LAVYTGLRFLELAAAYTDLHPAGLPTDLTIDFYEELAPEFAPKVF
jgi:hypothetical protein